MSGRYQFMTNTQECGKPYQYIHFHYEDVTIGQIVTIKAVCITHTS